MATFETELTETVSSMGALHAASEMYHGLRTEQALIAQVTSMNADHVLAALTEAYVEEESRKKEVRELKTHMKRILSTCQSWDEQHSVALQAIRTDALAEAIENVFKVSEANECNTSLTSAEKPKPYELAADFLRSSGKTDLLDACEDAHVRLLDLVQQRRSALVACARQLLKYLNVAKVYPSRIVEQSLQHHWARLLNHVLAEDAVDFCNDRVLSEISSVAVPPRAIQSAREVEKQLVRLYDLVRGHHVQVVKDRPAGVDANEIEAQLLERRQVFSSRHKQGARTSCFFFSSFLCFCSVFVHIKQQPTNK
eukprot:m.182858 g.182858  ORF g.182858 m.182858 type:complete len:311 (+) comp16649_c0_seq4:916-1848(+)